MYSIPKKAFVLAAGLGTRMKNLTYNCPKPMLKVNGITMLDYALDSLEQVGVEEVVVNTSYLAEIIEKHLENRLFPKIIISREDEPLETAGGVKKLINHFGDEAFYVLNSDVLWTDGKIPALELMAKSWDSNKMDLMLLMQPLETANFYSGSGDYYLQNNFGRPIFAKKKDSSFKANCIFAGPRIVNPRLFDDIPEGKLSFLELFHKAEANQRLYGLQNEGEWFHVGTPEALEETNNIFATQEKKKAV